MTLPDNRSPVRGIDLEGYAEEPSVVAGGSISLMFSGATREADLSVVRLVHGDPARGGPGYKDDPVDWGQPASVRLVRQRLQLGSHVEIPSSAVLNPVGSFTIGLWIYPTAFLRPWQAIVGKWEPLHLSY